MAVTVIDYMPAPDSFSIRVHRNIVKVEQYLYAKVIYFEAATAPEGYKLINDAVAVFNCENNLSTENGDMYANFDGIYYRIKNDEASVFSAHNELINAVVKSAVEVGGESLTPLPL